MAEIKTGRAQIVLLSGAEFAVSSGRLICLALDRQGRRVMISLTEQETDRLADLVMRARDRHEKERLSCSGFEQAPGSIGCKHCRRFKKDHGHPEHTDGKQNNG